MNTLYVVFNTYKQIVKKAFNIEREMTRPLNMHGNQKLTVNAINNVYGLLMLMLFFLFFFSFLFFLFIFRFSFIDIVISAPNSKTFSFLIMFASNNVSSLVVDQTKLQSNPSHSVGWYYWVESKPLYNHLNDLSLECR